MRKKVSVINVCVTPPCIGVFMLILFYSTLAFSQFDISDFNQYTTKQGFTDDNVTCITQDHFGFLWVGTSHGLNRFDGSNVETFTNHNDPSSLQSDEIVRLDWIDSMQLLVSTTRGFHVVNIETLRQQNILIPPGPLNLSSKVNRIRNVLTDQQGNVYVITRTGLYQFNATWELVFRYDDYDEAQGEYSGGFGDYSFWLDQKNILLVGQQGFYQYHTEERKITKFNGEQPDYLTFKILSRLKGKGYTPFEIRPGNILVFFDSSDTIAYVDELEKRITYSHLHLNPIRKEITWRSNFISSNDSTIWVTGQISGIFNLHVNTTAETSQIDTAKLFKQHSCNTVFSDRDHRIWIGTNAGLFKQHQPLVNIEFGKFPDSIISSNPKTSLYQITTDEKNVYALGPMSGGVYVFNKEDLSFVRKDKIVFTSNPYKTSRAIAAWNKDTILCGTDEGLFWYASKNQRSGKIDLPDWDIRHNWIAEVFVDSHHRVWISSNGGGGYYLSEGSIHDFRWVSLENTIAKELTEIYQMVEDPAGNVWLAGLGMARYNNDKKEIDYYAENFPVLRDDLKMITAIACDRFGGIWFGNASNGLVYFNPVTHDTLVYTEADGLPDRLINAITTDSQYVWISCHSGVGRMDLEHRRLINAINKEDLHFNGISSDKIYVDDQDKTYYLGTGHEMMRFKPGDLRDDVKPAHLIIESIGFGNDSLVFNPSSKIYTDWDHRDLTLTFCAINFHDAEDQSYSYRTTDNEDTSWINLGKQRKIFFSSLNAGRHNVEIKVSSSNHRWPVQKLFFSMVIHPPFWRSWWFYILCFAVIIATIYGLFNYRITHLKKVIMVRERISQDLHDEVGATLSGIAMYSYLTKEQMKSGQSAEMEKSLNVIQQSSTEMVTKLNDIIWAVDPQHDSLQKLVQRLEEYAIEIAATKNIRVEVNVPKDIEQLKVPMKSRRNIYLICKEAINNAVKYSEATIIELNVKEVDHSLEFVVRDNGIGFDPEIVKRGNGLENMQKRSDDIGAKLTLESGTQKGSTVSIRVSLHE